MIASRTGRVEVSGMWYKLIFPLFSQHRQVLRNKRLDILSVANTVLLKAYEMSRQFLPVFVPCTTMPTALRVW